jgi:hypothetical protein
VALWTKAAVALHGKRRLRRLIEMPSPHRMA